MRNGDLIGIWEAHPKVSILNNHEVRVHNQQQLNKMAHDFLGIRGCIINIGIRHFSIACLLVLLDSFAGASKHRKMVVPEMAVPEMASPRIQRTNFLCAPMPLDGSFPLAVPEMAFLEVPYVESRNLSFDYHVLTFVCSA